MAKKTTQKKPPMKVLFAASEAFPLLKTGGLGDVANSLPNALVALGVELRLVMPAFRSVFPEVEDLQLLGWLNLGSLGEVRVWEAYHPAFRMPLWLVDSAVYFDRVGNPYTNGDGNDWVDNPQRFTAFSRAVALLAIDALGVQWRPDVVHANDWQTGLVSAFLSLESRRPRTLYTIHNLAYDCQFDYAGFQALKLPPHWWSMEHAEFYGRFSLMKAGLVFSDVVNTVSPTYANEICTAEYGYGYAGILQSYRSKLFGILNGIDTGIWNPATDSHLAANYKPGEDIRAARLANRQALLAGMDADHAAIEDPSPLIGFVGRLVYQKGIDLLFDAMPDLLRSTDARFAIIGTGEAALEARLRQLVTEFPQRVFSYIGYSEQLAHLLEAGSDMFVMPSRYEPCGLNQLYSLHYGTPPIVRRTGGLADTVFDADQNPPDKANGFVFDTASADALALTLQRALLVWRDPAAWARLQNNGMRQEVDWQRSARGYLALYQQ